MHLKKTMRVPVTNPRSLIIQPLIGCSVAAETNLENDDKQNRCTNSPNSPSASTSKPPEKKNTLSDIFWLHRVKNLRTFESQQLAPSKLQVEMQILDKLHSLKLTAS